VNSEKFQKCENNLFEEAVGGNLQNNIDSNYITAVAETADAAGKIYQENL